MHRITTNLSQRLIHAELGGFLSCRDVEAFFEAEQVAARALGCGSRRHLLLVDASAFVPQSQNVVTFFQDAIERRAIKPRRAAIAVGSALAKRQICRMTTGHSNVCYFENAQRARDWLLAD